MTNHTKGTAMITAAAVVFLYGIYLWAGTVFTAIIGAFFLYVAGYTLKHTRDDDTKGGRRVDPVEACACFARNGYHTDAVTGDDLSLPEVRFYRGMN